jgi:hypothetical protein
MHSPKELCLMGFVADESVIRNAIDSIYQYGRGPGQVRYGFFDRAPDGYFTEIVVECDPEEKVSIVQRITEEIVNAK